MQGRRNEKKIEPVFVHGTEQPFPSNRLSQLPSLQLSYSL